MAAPGSLRIFAGDELGFVKTVFSENCDHVDLAKMVNRWGEGQRRLSADCVCVPEASGSASELQSLLAVGRGNGSLEVLDSLTGDVLASYRSTQGIRDPYAGLNMFTSAEKVTLLSCSQGGDVRISETALGEGGATLEEKTSWKVVAPVSCMRATSTMATIAVGGEGRVLALWDVETQKLKFRAKVPDPDFLGLRPKPHVSTIAFLSNDDENKVLVGGLGQVGTSNHTVMLYDIAAAPRPSQKMDFGEALVTAITPAPGGGGAYVGDAHGKLAYVDFKKFAINGKLKGPSGSIRSLVHHPTLPILACTGLDRFVRFHDTQKNTLLHSVYLKQVGLSLAFDLAEVQTPKPAEAEEEEQENEQEEIKEASKRKKKQKKLKEKKNSSSKKQRRLEEQDE
mmetsp:Transcript_38710/g.84203  ORF Transcript_38710/g.84203 Transcript_38710/m.84203 type:complete len:396 (-) Transcript_38710:230-1417(-)